MADPDNPNDRPKPETDSPTPTEQTPLLNPSQNHNHQERQRSQARERVQGQDSEDLSQTLERLDKFLTFLGFNQSSLSSFALSWTAFFIVGVLPPVVVLQLSECQGCQEYQIKDFELDIVASQACLAAVSLLCLSHNLRKYGVRRFLFVDRHSGHMFRLRDDYIRQISGSFRLLVMWALPIFLLKTVREIVRILYADRESWWLSIAILLALVVSWTYGI